MSVNLFLRSFLGRCRNLKIKEIGKDKALANHTIRTIQPISDFDTCIKECFLDLRCFTFNLCTKRDGALTCNLLNSDHIRSRKELVERSGCTYYGSEVREKGENILEQIVM